MSSATVNTGLLSPERRNGNAVTASELRSLVRALPLSASEREARLIYNTSLALAVLLHLVAITAIALTPNEPPPKKVAIQGAPLASVEVVLITEQEEPEQLEPTLDLAEALEPAPTREEPPDLAPIQAMKLHTPKTKTKRTVRRKMVAKAPEAPAEMKVAEAPKAPTKVITSTAADAAANEGTTSDIADAAQNTTAGAANGSPDGTDSTTQTGADTGSKVGADIDLAGLRRAYMRKVSKRVRRRYKYPRSAARAGMTGRVLVEVTIDAAGNIVSTRVKRSSGHDKLDQAALRSISSVGKLPAPPTELGWTSKRVTIPFDYTLRG